jgi:PIN domain nuclease of toxin-antitoxin system
VTDGCSISIINWVEVLWKIVDWGESPEEIIKGLKNEIFLEKSLEIPCIEEDAITIAKFRPLSKSVGFSLGDRACLGLGKRLNLSVLTADKFWTSLCVGITINLIGWRN